MIRFETTDEHRYTQILDPAMRFHQIKILIALIVLTVVGCTNKSHQDQYMIDVKGVGVFKRVESGSGEFKSVRYEREVQIGEDNVILITYTYEGTSIADPKYQAKVTSVFNALKTDLHHLLNSVDQNVKALAESYGARYATNWPTRVQLHLVRIPYEDELELSLESHHAPIGEALFHGLDLNLRFDREWVATKVWFDG